MSDTKCICAAGPKTPVRNVYQILIAGKKDVYLVKDRNGNMEAYTRCARNSSEDGYCTQHLKKVKKGGEIPLFDKIKKKGVLATESHPYFKNFLKKNAVKAVPAAAAQTSNIPPPIRQIFNDKSGDEWVLKCQQQLIKIAVEAINDSIQQMPKVCIEESDSEDEQDTMEEIEKEIVDGYLTNKKDTIRKNMMKNPDIEKITAKNGVEYFLDKNVFDVFDTDHNKLGEMKIVSDKYKKKSSLIYHNDKEDKDCNAIIAIKEEYDGKSYYRCIINNFVYDLQTHRHVGKLEKDKFISK
jgi:hypothetical protein